MKNGILFIGAIGLIISSCSSPKPTNEEGKNLAASYCGSCHQVPSPDQLDKKTWVLQVLPKMGPRVGIYSYQGLPYEVSKNSPGMPKGYYPDSAALSVEDWGKIVSYFYDNAPDSLHGDYPPISLNQTSF